MTNNLADEKADEKAEEEAYKIRREARRQELIKILTEMATLNEKRGYSDTDV